MCRYAIHIELVVKTTHVVVWRYSGYILHINNQCVCEVAQGPRSLGTNIWGTIVQGSEDGVCRVCNEHYILNGERGRNRSQPV